MTQTAVTISGISNTVVAGNGTTYYGPWGSCNFSQSATTVEANFQNKLSVATTGANLTVATQANARTTTTTINSRNATAAGNMTVAIPTTSTALVSDATHSDSYAANALTDTQTVMGASAENYTCASIAMTQSTAGQATLSLSAMGNAAGTVSVTRFVNVVGGLSINATESAAQVPALEGCTLSYMVVRYSGTNAATFTSRVAGGAGNASITANASATFFDVTHTDSVTSGQLFNQQVVYGSSVSNTQLAGFEYAGSTSGQNVNYAGVSATAGNTSVQYMSVTGKVSKNSTEALVQTGIPAAGSVNNFTVAASAFGTGAQTVQFRKNSTNGNQSVSVSAISTVTDVTHSDNVIAGDLINMSVGAGFTAADGINIAGLLYANTAVVNANHNYLNLLGVT